MRKLLPAFLIFLFANEAIQAQCNAAFTVAVNGSTVQLQAAWPAPTQKHYWAFGDGINGSGNPVSHTYQAPGVYNILHIAYDTVNTCLDSVVQVVNIQFADSCKASFVALPDTLDSHIYKFISTSTAPDSIHSYWWTVNGTPVSALPAFFDTLVPGTNEVCLQITTIAGCHSTACKTFWIDSSVNCTLQASFTAKQKLYAPDITFTASPIRVGLFYKWDFGDGHSSNLSTPVHTYVYGRSYPVQLIITDSLTGCSDTTSQNVVVTETTPDTCKVTVTHTQDPLNPGKVSFTMISDHTFITQLWAIYPTDSLTTPAKASFYKSPNPTHVFTYPGWYEACVLARTNNGCSAYDCDSVKIIGADSSNLISSYPNPVQGTNVTLVVNVEHPAKIKLTVFNSFGNIVYKNEMHYAAGNARLSIPVQNLPRGQYFVDIQYGNIRKRSVFQKF